MPPGLPVAVIVTGQPGEFAVCRRGALPVLEPGSWEVRMGDRASWIGPVVFSVTDSPGNALT